MNIQRSRTVAPRLVLILSLLLCPLEATAAVGEALRDRMNNGSVSETLPVIVTFADQVAAEGILPLGLRGRGKGGELVQRLRSRADLSQGALRDFLRKRGVKGVRSLWIINALALEATPDLVATLAAWPGVASVTLDGIVPLPEVLPAQIPGVEWNVEAVRAPDLWVQGFDGTGVVVATLDSGVDPLHPALAVNRRASASWFNPYAEACVLSGNCSACDASDDIPCDASGHGTAVMGVAVGAGGIGVAPGAEWIAAKIFNDSGAATYSAIHAAFEWALDPNGDSDTEDAPDIVNNSWNLDGGTECFDEFQDDIRLLKAAGISVVFAAGNTAAFVTSPANYPESVAVGMVDQSNLIDPLSSRGASPCDPLEPFPELVAPGVQIRTADLTLSGTFPNAYQTISGTSFSAPHVSGVLALLLDAFPGLSPAALETTLFASAVDLGEAGADNVYGYGLVNAFNALESLSGNPVVSLHDPVAPVDDGILPFGNIPPGTSRDLAVTVANSGGGVLTITSVGGAGLVPPFSLLAETCSGANLVSGENCTVTLRFGPLTHDIFSGTLEMLGSAGPFSVALSGSGNTAPVPPLLVFPASGSAGLDRPVTLGWIHPGDADGDQVTEEVVISISPHLASSLSRSLLPTGTGAMLAGFGLAGMLFLRRRFALAGSAALLILLAFLLSCGGGGGTAPPPLTADRTFLATDLAPATTYYWKIVSSDGFGGSSQSATWSFTTR